MNNLQLDLENYEDSDYTSEVCTNYDLTPSFNTKETKFSSVFAEDEFCGTMDMMEDSLNPILPSSLQYLIEWRIPNSDKRQSLERFSIESHGMTVPRLSLTQGESDPSKANPFEVSAQYKEMTDINTDKESINEENNKQMLSSTSTIVTRTILKGCNCKKTNCLKFYCECFASGKVCGTDCNCTECRNVESNQNERQEVVLKIMRKHPLSIIRNAKDSRIEVGCNCKKTSCQRNYCFCFRRGLKCNNQCQCIDCCNKAEEKVSCSNIFTIEYYD